MKTSKEIRQMWIDYFVSKKHLFIESKSLIPHKDPSLLWINSGVATLKDYFSGKKTPPSKRLVNSQKSIRTNDIENVGVTARHHTFFEMLGNFSIGDYFKEEAIEFADEFVTKVLCLDKNKLYITYFEEDNKVRDKWLSLGYKKEQLIPGSKELNFWDVGSGPCGPNTEIFYDRGEKYHLGGPELIANDIENDRFIEIWNIVFSEFNNMGDGKYVELAQKNIDTGAGLERIVSILQDGPTNFDTDLFLPIIYEVEKISNYKYDIKNYFTKDAKQDVINKHFKIIADHMRAITNAINDGEKPSNTQRGYVIRRLIRRAYYSGSRLGIKEKSFLYKLVKIVSDSLIFNIDVEKVSQIIKKEEIAFSTTIEQGKKYLDDAINKTKNKKFDVDVAFKLYETFGFPIEMTNDILLENNLTLDFKKLQELKELHSQKSKVNNEVISFDKQINSLERVKMHVSDFVGYEKLHVEDTRILFLLDEQSLIEETKEDQISYLILRETPLYATSGGQLHDRGHLTQNGNFIELLDVFKDKHNNNVHVVRGLINSKYPISAIVDKKTRLGLMRNHSATHLTFAALRHVYGKDIEQLGSDNNQDRLTFDFPLDRKPTNFEIKQIENFVRDVIKQNIKREYIITTTKEAKEMGAIMTIDEMEYFDTNSVRVVDFPGITKDLCGGTHIDYTKNLEAFKIINVESKGTGIYRIRAITSNELVNKYLMDEYKKYKDILKSMYAKYTEIYKTKSTQKTYINLTIDDVEVKNLEEDLDSIKNVIEWISNETKKIIKEPNKIVEDIEIHDIKIEEFDILASFNVDKMSLKELSVIHREKNPNKIIMFVSTYENNKSSIIITSKKFDVIKFKNLIEEKIDIKGGGNALIWQGVTTDKIILDDLQKKFFF